MKIDIPILALCVSAGALIHSVITRKKVEHLSVEEKRTHCLTEIYNLQSRYGILTNNLMDVKKGMRQHREKEHALVGETLEQADREIEEITKVEELVREQKVNAVEIEKLRPRIEGLKLRQQRQYEVYESLKEFKKERGMF